MSLAALNPLQFRRKQEDSPAAFLAKATANDTYAKKEPDNASRYLRGVAAGYHDAPGEYRREPRPR